VVPVDALIDRVEATVSVGVRECCCRLGSGGCSFARAAEDLSYVGGVRLSAETLRTITEDEGGRVQKWCRDEQMLFDFECPPEREPEMFPEMMREKRPDPRRKTLEVIDPLEGPVLRVYASMDGVQTPTITESEKIKRRASAKTRRAALSTAALSTAALSTALGATVRGRRRIRRRIRRRPLPARKRGTDQRWKETKIVTLYNQGSSWRQVAATVGDHRAAGKLLAGEGAKIGLGSVDQIVAPVDGATYIRRQMEARLPARTQLVLDFFHLSGHVHEARREVFGENDQEGQAWVDKQLHTLRHEPPETSWQSLLDWRGTIRSPRKRQQADRLLGYVGERKPMLCYARCDEHGWDVGSGPMESMCKQLTRRLKGPGMRWDRPNIQAMAALECLYQSGQSDLYWKWRLQNN
jgi:hypothetical protein